MATLVFHPDDRLVTPAEEVREISQETADLTARMVALMHEAKGIGLAGPQVGDLRRLFVVHVPEDEARVFINPRIVARSLDEGPYEEGCLSIPGVYADVTRPLEITVEAFDADGAPFRIDAAGILARVIQHEYDHLDGVLFIDHLPRRRRERLMRSYRSPAAAIADE